MGSNREQEFTENMEQLSGTNYQTVAKSLSANFVEKADQEACDAAQENHKASQRNVLETGRMLNMGNIEESQVSCSAAFAFAAAKRGETLQKEKKAKATADALFLAMLRDQMAALDKEIAEIRTELEDKYGPDYIENVAEEVLGEIPERMEGESQAEYVARLEQELMDKMIDPATGELREEYRNHPSEQVKDVARLIEKEANRNIGNNVIRTFEDPNSTPEQLEKAKDLISNPENVEAATFSAALLPNNSEMQVEVESIIDASADQELATAKDSSSRDFMNTGWSS
jgi:hypothetical protein